MVSSEIGTVGWSSSTSASHPSVGNPLLSGEGPEPQSYDVRQQRSRQPVVSEGGSSVRALGCVQGGVLTLQADAELSNVGPEALKAVVEYMYTGRLELTRDTMWGVMSAANYLELGGALGLCASFLESQMCAENVLDIARAGEEMNCVELRAEALGYTASHFEEVCGEESFLELREEEMREILGMDDLVVCEEWAVYESLTRWVDADATREAIFAELFGDVEVVRLSQMSEEQLESLRASPRAGHEALVQGKVGEESLRRNGQEAAPSRRRRASCGACRSRCRS